MSNAGTLTLRIYHFGSALLLATFVTLHMINHMVGLVGQAEHIAFMETARPIYRNIVIEPVLLTLFGFQIVSGMTMVVRGWRSRTGNIAWLQALSGLYLAVFIVLHTLAVFSGRFSLSLDTDFRFAAAGFHVPGWPWYFGPYYALAIAALFSHLGCASYWALREHGTRMALGVLQGMVAAGIILGGLMAAALAGLLYSVDIPAVYKATYLAG